MSTMVKESPKTLESLSGHLLPSTVHPYEGTEDTDVRGVTITDPHPTFDPVTHRKRAKQVCQPAA